ncbi:pre-RNA processing protein PIH1/Nop17 [Chloropicon primus]|uniref:PIH1 domain-containing protein 1 n=1 Tax=Chloropicon primus TaxID=1764295 RepID=A0A5B8MFK6_9CHLO|nr:pre-RNA processing protein PIH1/Nop17 [Chloropicon primus]|eukprot:QDZ19448.1 pre-RNA processing protein PIH1/Nop17 [Chloropicon primus]
MDKEETEMLRESLDKLNMTTEEVNRFEKAFQDPKFKEMFEEYAKEISDPKARAESEAYLRQIEDQNQTENVYGSDVQLIVPEENFVVKTRREDDGESKGKKMFINVCSSEKIQKAESKKTTRNGQEGNTWSIPFSLGQERETTDKSGNTAAVIDFVLHPQTCEKCSFPPFKEMVAQTAIENIERTKGMKLCKTVTYLKMKYKGSEGMEKPGVQSVRISSANGGKGPIKPLSEPKTDLGQPSSEPTKRSEFSFNRAVEKPKRKPPAPKEGEAGYVYASGETVPQFEVVERGQYDLLDTWGDMGQALAEAPKRPKEITLKVVLPGVKGVGSMSLDVTSQEVLLSVPDKYKLEAKLPYEVLDKKGKAKFDKKKQVLEITLPVVSPEKPQAKPFVEPVKLVQELESTGHDKGEESGSQPEEPQKEEAAGGASSKAAKGTGEGAPNAGEETENERRWKAMHEAAAAPQADEKETEGEGSRGSAAQEDSASPQGGEFLEMAEEASGNKVGFIASKAFCGQVLGYAYKLGGSGLGYYREVGSVESEGDEENLGGSGSSAKGSVNQSSFIVKPSPSAALWDDLD